MRLQLRVLVAALAVGLMAGIAGGGDARAEPPPPPSSPQASPSPPPQAPPPPPSSSSSSNLTEHVGLAYGQYVDSDHVFVETPSIAGTVSDPTAGWSFGGDYLVDVVSAASVDIVSTASRHWNEVRQEGNLHGDYKPGALGGAVDASVSSEPDYLSWSAGGALTLDLFNKNATLLLGYGHSHDVAGRTGTPFSVFSRAIDRDAFKASMSLVLGPRTLATLLGDVILENGDQSKPYRYIPMFAPGVDVPVGASIDAVNSLRSSARPLEQLPLSRQRYALTGRLAHRLHLATLRVEERLYADSWAMVATTTDARYLFDLGRRVETGPHARVHAQSASSFWRRAYTLGPGLDVPAFRTGDRELGPLFNLTGGWTLQLGIGGSRNPTSWVLGFHLDGTSTRYLDDLYITQRVSVLGGVTLETDLVSRTRTPLAWLVALLLVPACDPVHDDAIAALGPEQAGVRRGPLHRPGQPCLQCHDGELGDPQRFTVAGTVFLTPDSLAPADGVDVRIIDAHDAVCSISTNAAGNFYFTPETCDPTFPLKVELRPQPNLPPAAVMQTLVGGNGTTTPINGACASCHFDPAGPNSPGHVYLKTDDGGAPL